MAAGAKASVQNKVAKTLPIVVSPSNVGASARLKLVLSCSQSRMGTFATAGRLYVRHARAAMEPGRRQEARQPPGRHGRRGRANKKQEVAGFVTGFISHPGTFKFNGGDVQTTASTRFVGGTSADLVNGVKVEAEGVVEAGRSRVPGALNDRLLAARGRQTPCSATSLSVVARTSAKRAGVIPAGMPAQAELGPDFARAAVGRLHLLFGRGRRPVAAGTMQRCSK